MNQCAAIKYVQIIHPYLAVTSFMLESVYTKEKKNEIRRYLAKRGEKHNYGKYTISWIKSIGYGGNTLQFLHNSKKKNSEYLYLYDKN